MIEVRSTVVYDDVATELSARTDAGELWVGGADVSRATGFELKVQGVCRGALCYPLPPSGQSEFVRNETGGPWLNLTALARIMGQPVAHDSGHSVWYFGVRSEQQQQLASLEAPDFTLPDLDGKPHSLSGFRGKKVFLVTWASW